MKDTIIFGFIKPQGKKYAERIELLKKIEEYIGKGEVENIQDLIKMNIKYEKIIELLTLYIVEDFRNNGAICGDLIELEDKDYKLLKKLLNNISSRLSNKDITFNVEKEL